MKQFVLISIALMMCSCCLAASAGGSGATGTAEAGVQPAQSKVGETFGPGQFSSADCAFTFTAGAKNTFQKFCVTANGNVTVFESPLGQEHIAVGRDGEGYGVCDVNAKVAYSDYAEFGDTANWGQPSVLRQEAKSAVIARTTSDGQWTLTQTFTLIGGKSPAATIAMKLTNNTAGDRTTLLVRYADADAAGLSLNNLDATREGAFAWNSAGTTGQFGLALENVGTPPASSFRGIARTVPEGPSPCAPLDHQFQGTITNTDGSVVMAYSLDIAAGKSKTVTVRYRGF